MSVLVEVAPQVIPFGEQPDARWPIGMWIITASATGDATGGNLGCQVNFRGDLLYSVEEAEPETTGGVAFIAAMGLQVIFGDILYGFNSAVELIVTDTSNVSQTARASKLLGGGIIFQGHPTSSFLNAERQNGAAVSMQLQAWGYVWDRVAYALSGGPRKPHSILTL